MLGRQGFVVVLGVLEAQDICRAFSRALAKTGNRMAANIAIIAITTNSSISVKPLE
jgi:hypothetical protein